MSTIAFITTCKGRLHHVRRTLPLLVAEKPHELIVVDYGCPDGVGDWVEEHHPSVKVVRVSDDPEFCTARARNIGAQATQAQWLVFIDADVLVKPGWITWMQANVSSGCFYRPSLNDGRRDLETYGTTICNQADFALIGGYDEAFRGWGGDDEDFYRRLARGGVTQKEYPHRFVEAIRHGDEERAGWAGMRSRAEQQTVHECYMAAKEKMETCGNHEQLLPLHLRKEVMSATSLLVRNWFSEGMRQPLTLRYVISRSKPSWMPPPLQMEGELNFVIRVRNPQTQPRRKLSDERISGSGPQHPEV